MCLTPLRQRPKSSWPSLRREESGGFSRGEEPDHFTEFFSVIGPMLYLFSFSSKRPFPAFAGDSKLVCVLQAHRHVHRSLTVDKYRASLGVLLSFLALLDEFEISHCLSALFRLGFADTCLQTLVLWSCAKE